jgi:hypothetical protein
MFDERRAVRELTALANKWTLEVSEYERLAMAVFGEMLAKDAAKAELWKQRQGKLIFFSTYVDGRRAIEDSRALDPCWKRLRQDLYSGQRAAFVGVQCAFQYAKQTGLLTNPRWGGERKREVERLFHRQGIDPMAPPGLSTTPEDASHPRPRRETPTEYVRPDVRTDSIRALPISEQLGIADAWIELSDTDRFLVNAIIEDLGEDEKVRYLRKLAGNKLYTRDRNADLPPVYGDWLRGMPRQLIREVETLPPRSQSILAVQYQAAGRSAHLLHTEINNQMVMSRGRVSGEELLRLVIRKLCSAHDSIGALRSYEMRLEQGQMSFPAYLQLRERHVPELAARERALAARQERDRQLELIASLQAIRSDPGLKHISQTYSEMWEIANRTEWQSFVAMGEGFVDAGVGTVEGLWTLVTTDPRKTAAGLYHMAKNPQILIVSLDDAMVDQEKFAGGILFELTLTALGAGPASKASYGTKASRLARAAEKAAEGGKLRAARKLAEAAEEAAKKARIAGEALDGADGAILRARNLIETKAPGVAAKVAEETGELAGDAARVAARARAADVAPWVHRDAAVGLQRAVDAGPNRWGALPNRPTGKRFQRGLSGDYASGAGGLDEAKDLLRGAPDKHPRTVSQIHERMPPGKTTHEVTAGYSDPMSIRGRADRIDPTAGRDPVREAMIKSLSIEDVEAIGFFPNRTDPLGWTNNYLSLLEQTKTVPAAGSRGERFVKDLQAVLAKAEWAENDYGRFFANRDELNTMLREVFVRYGSRE